MTIMQEHAYSGMEEALLKTDVDMYSKVGISRNELMELDSQKKKEIEEKVQGWILEPTQKPKDMTMEGPEKSNIIIAGCPGVGKSTIGNLLLGQTHFKENASLESSQQDKPSERCKYEGMEFKLFEFRLPPSVQFVDKTIVPKGRSWSWPWSKCAKTCEIKLPKEHGYHVVVFVLNAANVRMIDEFAILKNFEKQYPDIYQHAMVVYTHAEAVCKTDKETTIRDYMQEKLGEKFGDQEYLKLLSEELGNRVLMVDNNATKYQRDVQRHAIFEMIQRIPQRNQMLSSKPGTVKVDKCEEANEGAGV